MRLPPLFPIMQAARAHGVSLEHAYLIWDHAKEALGGGPAAPRAWREWAADEAAAENSRGAIDFYWWACSQLGMGAET